MSVNEYMQQEISNTAGKQAVRLSLLKCLDVPDVKQAVIDWTINFLVEEKLRQVHTLTYAKNKEGFEVLEKFILEEIVQISEMLARLRGV